MRLLDILNIINEAQFLVERDVLNAKELKAWVKESAARIREPQAQTWFASQLFKYLINRYEEGARPLMQAPEGAPEWLAAKLAAGEPVLNIDPQQELRQEAEGVIDWLNAEPKADLRMTWEQAVEAQAEWHSEIKRATRVTELTPEEMKGLVTIKEYDTGFKWVDVQTEVCLKHEGTSMGHCVGQGGYTQGVQEGTTKIISLRDAKGLAHATIEGTSEHPITIEPTNANQLDLFKEVGAKSLVDMEVHQLKGKENKGVSVKYRDYIQDFLMTFGIDKFTSYGLSDLENSGLFKLRKGGYAPVSEVGKKMVDIDDGTHWSRVGSELVELRDYNTELHAKWYLQDKGERGIGNAQEKVEGVIDSMNFGYRAKLKKHKEHVKALFSTGLKPGEHMYSDHAGLQNYGLAVGQGEQGFETVGEPQEVGEKIADIDAGTVYQTREKEKAYWLMHGDHIISHFTIKDLRATANDTAVTLTFDKQRSVPRGSMPKFLDEVAKFSGMDISRVQIQGRNISVADIAWTPGPSDEQIMEQDDVLFYADKRANETHYSAIDSHEHLLFTMVYQDGKGSFTPVMVNDTSVAGYYAIYLIDKLELDVGEYKQYDSFNREILDATGWFQSENSYYDYTQRRMGGGLTWYYMDDDFPILLTIVEWDQDGNDSYLREKEETEMSTFWSETSLDGSGLENDYFASEMDELYNGHTIKWEDEHDTSDPEENRSSTDYYADSNGDSDTVTHPTSGGSMRVAR